MFVYLAPGIGRINALLANRILVLDQGRIVEQGDHEQLLRLDGHARLHRYQNAPGLPASLARKN